MNKKAIIIDKDYGSMTYKELDQIKKEFLKQGIDLELAHCETEEEIIKKAKGKSAILGTGNPNISKRVLESLDQLKVVQRFGIGVNSIDLLAATEEKKLIMNMPGFCIGELAEHALSMILNLLRNTSYYDKKIRKGYWPKAEYYTPRSLSDLTVGLFGYGGSARALHKIIEGGFGSRVIATDPFLKDKNIDIELVNFENLLKESDIISIHVPFNEQTKNTFNSSIFDQMKKGSMIINISRGGIINEKDLIEALEEDKIRFAGLDVFEKEPLKDSKLIELDNTILTPHSGFYGENAKKRQIEWSVKLVSQVLNENKVNIDFLANKDVIEVNNRYEYIGGR